jgi:hypothetical protein
MLDCKEVAGILASDGLEEAAWTRRLAVRFHLMMCRHCRRYAAQLRAIGVAASRIFGPRGKTGDPDVLRRLERTILGKQPDGRGE